jgi:hypothetical protein
MHLHRTCTHNGQYAPRVHLTLSRSLLALHPHPVLPRPSPSSCPPCQTCDLLLCPPPLPAPVASPEEAAGRAGGLGIEPAGTHGIVRDLPNTRPNGQAAYGRRTCLRNDIYKPHRPQREGTSLRSRSSSSWRVWACSASSAASPGSLRVLSTNLRTPLSSAQIRSTHPCRDRRRRRPPEPPCEMSQ